MVMTKEIIAPDLNELSEHEVFVLDIMIDELSSIKWHKNTIEHFVKRYNGKELYDRIREIFEYEFSGCYYDYDYRFGYDDENEEEWKWWLDKVNEREPYKAHGFPDKELVYMGNFDIDDWEFIECRVDGDDYPKECCWRYAKSYTMVSNDILKDRYLNIINNEVSIY